MLFMAWPAFYNGFPLWFADTLNYLQSGRPIARALFHHRMSSYYGLHSLIYSLSIFPFHWDITPWPIIALQCLSTSFVLWLVVRSIVQKNVFSRFLILVLFLSLCTSFSWYASFLMPDILGPVLYLAIYLLAFARETISRVERYALYLISWWAIASHVTHLLVAIGLFLLLALLAAFRSSSLRKNVIPMAELASIILLALGAQAALNAYLDSQSPENASNLPYLTAQLVGDGAGRQYLQSYCGETNWEVCQYSNHLAGNYRDFLWNPKGVWMSATADAKKTILRQDLPLAIAILRAYPMEQFELFAANSWRQFTSFDLEAFERHKVAEKRIGAAMPRMQSQFLESRQEHDQIPRGFLTVIQDCTLTASLLGLAAVLPWLWRRRPAHLLGLGYVTLSAIVLNALVLGALLLPTVENKFQCRVIWLAPLLAAMCVMKWQESRSEAVKS